MDLLIKPSEHPTSSFETAHKDTLFDVVVGQIIPTIKSRSKIGHLDSVAIIAHEIILDTTVTTIPKCGTSKGLVTNSHEVHGVRDTEVPRTNRSQGAHR